VKVPVEKTVGIVFLTKTLQTLQFSGVTERSARAGFATMSDSPT
jgi:hypothetical protein